MTVRNERHLTLTTILREGSCFLFGPRGAGKSKLVNKHCFNMRRHILDLQKHEVFMRFSRNPEPALRDDYSRYGAAPGSVVIIDDIHRIPALLDVAYDLIEKQEGRFLFVTSSAHKLLKNGRKLKPDLVGTRWMHPLSASETGGEFNLERALPHGLLPVHYNTMGDISDMLRAYVSLYLQEELVQSTGADNIPSFHRLLVAMAERSGELTNYADLALQTKVPRSTVQEYVRTIIDTGMAVELPAWKKSTKLRAIRTSKLYLFDTGVVRFLREQHPTHNQKLTLPHNDITATLFEHWVLHELRCFIATVRPDVPLSYWRSASGLEVDFIFNDETAIAVNGSTQIGSSALRGLRALQEEGLLKHYLLVCCETEARELDEITVLPWQFFVRRLWAGELT